MPANGYEVIIPCLKQLIAHKSDPVLLAHLCAGLTIAPAQLPLAEDRQTFLQQIIALLIYHDPKYINALVTKTTLLADLRTLLQATQNEPHCSPAFVSSLFSLISYLGKSSLPKMIDAGVISCVEALSNASSQPKLQLEAFQVLNNLGHQRTASSEQVSANLLAALQRETMPTVKAQCLSLLKLEVVKGSSSATFLADLPSALAPFLSDPAILVIERTLDVFKTMSLPLATLISSGVLNKYSQALLRPRADSEPLVIQYWAVIADALGKYLHERQWKVDVVLVQAIQETKLLESVVAALRATSWTTSCLVSQLALLWSIQCASASQFRSDADFQAMHAAADYLEGFEVIALGRRFVESVLMGDIVVAYLVCALYRLSEPSHKAVSDRLMEVLRVIFLRMGAFHMSDSTPSTTPPTSTSPRLLPMLLVSTTLLFLPISTLPHSSYGRQSMRMCWTPRSALFAVLIL